MSACKDTGIFAQDKKEFSCGLFNISIAMPSTGKSGAANQVGL
ncbi:MAG: hypothetical protein ACTHMI_11140 [Mucilaginibacter sp.]